VLDWTRANGHAVGAIVQLRQVWDLAKAWYADPRARNWRPRSRDQSQSVITSVGLTGPFWELPK